MDDVADKYQPEMIELPAFSRVPDKIRKQIKGGQFNLAGPRINQNLINLSWAGPDWLTTKGSGSLIVTSDGKIRIAADRNTDEPIESAKGYPRTADFSGETEVYDLRREIALNPQWKGRIVILDPAFTPMSNGVNTQTRAGANYDLAMSPGNAVVTKIAGTIGGGKAEGSTATAYYRDFDVWLV